MYLEYLSRAGKYALDANSSATGFSNPANLTAAPSEGTGYRLFATAQNPAVVPSRMRLFPFGVGSENDAFSIRVWALYKLLVSATYFYFQAPILEISATLGTRTGITGGLLTTSTRWADTISIVATVGEPTTTANTTRDGTTVLYSPANDTVAWVEIDTRGAIGHYFDFDQTTGTPTMNAALLYMN